MLAIETKQTVSASERKNHSRLQQWVRPVNICIYSLIQKLFWTNSWAQNKLQLVQGFAWTVLHVGVMKAWSELQSLRVMAGVRRILGEAELETLLIFAYRTVRLDVSQRFTNSIMLNWIFCFCFGSGFQSFPSLLYIHSLFTLPRRFRLNDTKGASTSIKAEVGVDDSGFCSQNLQPGKFNQSSDRATLHLRLYGPQLAH